MTYSDAELDKFEALFEQAAWDLDEDSYFELILKMDPDQAIETALFDRQHKVEAIRRAALTDEERAAEDARSERMMQQGMAVVREIMKRRKAARS